ncbi:hypothetical protein LIER_09278 [Lithospermum erythrorhizon]|uniref:Reverse transcriptase domain-containing protein n=1 Tax=Lithospermum erythrorhizon TaxID=34254 RepID=A0AAV3PH11_LITER
MSGVDPGVAVHRIYVDLHYKPIKKKKRTFSKDEGEAIREEVNKLLGEDAIHKLLFQLGWPMWCLSENQTERGGCEQTSPASTKHVPRIVTHYPTLIGMAFGLKNVGARYQRMVNKVLSKQIGRDMEIYVDDMLITSQEAQDHEVNLRESFKNLRKYIFRLNPDKCVFGIRSGKFLGYIINQRGIEPKSKNDSRNSVRVILAAQGKRYCYCPRRATRLNMLYGSPSTNNKAEYEALANGLTLENALGAELIHIRTDSQLLVGHVKGDFKIDKTKERSEADRLSQLTTTGYETLPEAIILEWVEEEAFRTNLVMNNVPKSGLPEPWYQVVLDFFRTRTLPTNPPVSNKIQRKSLRYTKLDGLLCRRSFQVPLLRCVTRKVGLMLLEEVHGGMCRSHISTRALTHLTQKIL